MLKRKMLLLAAVILSIFTLVAYSGNDDPFKNAKIVDVMNGSGTEVLGQITVIEMPSEEVTDEYLVKWNEEHVKGADYRWAVIVYTDKENEGVYTDTALIQKNVKLEPNDDGTYSNAGETENTEYYIVKDGKLTPAF